MIIFDVISECLTIIWWKKYYHHCKLCKVLLIFALLVCMFFSDSPSRNSVTHNRMSGSYNITEHSSTGNYFHFCDDYWAFVLLWFSCNIVIALFGFPASVAVLFELFQKHKKGIPTTPNDVFLVNLTVMDSFFLFFLPIGVSNYVNWKIWEVECVFNFLYSFTACGRPLFMTCICLDCYLAVVHPIMYRARKGLTSRVLMCVVVWAVTLAYGIAFILIDGLYYQPITLWPQLITLPTIGVCDFFILRALKSSDPAGRDLHPQKKKALQIIINSLVMTVITYLSPVLVFSMRTMMPGKVFLCFAIFPLISFTTAGSALMPVLYLNNLGKLGFIFIHWLFYTLSLSATGCSISNLHYCTSLYLANRLLYGHWHSHWSANWHYCTVLHLG